MLIPGLRIISHMISIIRPFILDIKAMTRFQSGMVKVWAFWILVPLRFTHLLPLSTWITFSMFLLYLPIFCMWTSLLKTIVSLSLILLVFLFRNNRRRRFFSADRVKMGCTHFLVPRVSNSSCPTAFLGEEVSADVWHQRLGHPSSTICQHIFSASTVSLKGSSTALSFCEYCRYAKSCKLPFSSPFSVTSKPLEWVHCDVWGPATIFSVSGLRYYFVFINDYLKYNWSFPMSCKSDVYDIFRCIQLQTENLLSLKIKQFHSDGGRDHNGSGRVRV